MSERWSVSDNFNLFDDYLTKLKVKVMSKFDVMMDDSRNPSVISDIEMKELDNFLQLGKAYRITTTIEEI